MLSKLCKIIIICKIFLKFGSVLEEQIGFLNWKKLKTCF